jgi:hypothetical protein
MCSHSHRSGTQTQIAPFSFLPFFGLAEQTSTLKNVCVKKNKLDDRLSYLVVTKLKTTVEITKNVQLVYFILGSVHRGRVVGVEPRLLL